MPNKNKKLKKHLHAHAKRRALERYGLQLNKDMRRQIIKAIQLGKAFCLEKQSLTRTLFNVSLGEQTIRVVYDTKRHAIATVLPPDTKMSQCRIDMAQNTP